MRKMVAQLGDVFSVYICFGPLIFRAQRVKFVYISVIVML